MLEEYHLSRSLQHESIVRTYDLIYANDMWRQIMEYHPRTLWEALVLVDGALHFQQASCIFRKLANGIGNMHAEGIAHQDLKLNIVMLDNNGNAVIVDLVSLIVSEFPWTGSLSYNGVSLFTSHITVLILYAALCGLF